MHTFQISGYLLTKPDSHLNADTPSVEVAVVTPSGRSFIIQLFNDLAREAASLKQGDVVALGGTINQEDNRIGFLATQLDSFPLQEELSH